MCDDAEDKVKVWWDEGEHGTGGGTVVVCQEDAGQLTQFQDCGIGLWQLLVHC